MIICCCCLWEALRGSLWGVVASSVVRRTPRRGAADARDHRSGAGRDAPTAFRRRRDRQRLLFRARAAGERLLPVCYSSASGLARRTDGWRGLGVPRGNFMRPCWPLRCLRGIFLAKAASKKPVLIAEQAQKQHRWVQSLESASLTATEESCASAAGRPRASHKPRCQRISRAIEDAADTRARVAQ